MNNATLPDIDLASLLKGLNTTITITPNTSSSLINKALQDSTYVQYRTYQSPLFVEQVANQWRNGHSSNFSALFSTQEDTEDYITGLVWLAMIVIVFYTCWSFALLLFCILGQKRVGFLSGKPFERVYYHTNQGQSVNYYNTSNHNSNEPIIEEETPQSSSGFLQRFSRNQTPSDDDDVYYDDTPKNANQDKIDNENDTAALSNQLGWSNTAYNNNKPVEALYSSPPPPRTKNSKEKNKVRSLYSSPPPTTTSTGLHPTHIEGGCKCCITGTDIAVWIRRIYILSGIIFILFSILMVTQGITQLQDTVETLNDSAASIEKLTAEAQSILTGVFNIESNATELRANLDKELNSTNFCPANPTFEDEASDAIEQIRVLVADAGTYLKKLEEYANSESLRSTVQSLNETNQGAAQVYSSTENIDLTDWESLIILIPFSIIPCFLVASAILAAYDVYIPKFHCFMVWVIMPLFVLLVFLSTTSAAITFMSAASNSDFCLPNDFEQVNYNLEANSLDGTKAANSPDISVLEILKNQGYPPGTDTYKTASFYILQCNDADPLLADPLKEYKEYLPTLDENLQAATDLINHFNKADTMAELSAYCGRDFDTLEESLQELQSIITLIVGSIIDMLDLLRCDNIVPIYQSTVYSGTCEYSVKAWAWLFSGLLITTFFGFLMIMFRSAYKPTHYTYTYDNNYGRTSNHNDATANIAVNTSKENTYGAGDTVIHSLENYEKENFTYTNTNDSYDKVAGAFK